MSTRYASRLALRAAARLLCDKFGFGQARLALATLLLLTSGLCFGTWPQRWNPSGSLNDEGQACVLDHQGDLYVAGKTDSGSGDWDIKVLKYSPTGGLLWQKEFDGAAHGDDVACGIAVDWRNDVYVAGYSTKSGPKTKLCVLKLNSSNGNPLWPSSGSGGSGSSAYVFDNGAIRLDDSNADGVDSTDEGRGDVCPIAIEDVDSDQPTFAICGPSNNGSGTKWRCVVFEDNGAGSIQIKSGWPVDLFGSSVDDVPYGIAINPTDHTPYCTGKATTDTDVYSFRTVRYQANGTGSSPAYMWYWDFSPTGGGSSSNKHSRGNDIKLDPAGTAFVTGAFNADAATAKIETVDEEASVDWAVDFGSHSEGLSLSLSYEMNEDMALDEFTYVAGYKNTTGLSNHDYDGLTIRYATDGSEVWHDVVATSGVNTQGKHIEAVGNGDAYVIGYTNKPPTGSSGTNGDYLIMGYEKGSSSAHFSTTYNNSNEFDEGRWGVMSLAGVFDYTGISDDAGNSHGSDFLTSQHVSTSDVLDPDDDDYFDADYVSGSLSDVDSSNDTYFEVQPTHMSSISIGMTMGFIGNVTTTNPTEISFTVEGHIDVDHIWQKVMVYDVILGDWVTVSDHAVTNGTDENTVIVLKDDPMQYIDGDGNVKIRVKYYGNAASTGWTQAGDGAFIAYFDLVQWNVLGS